MFGNERRMGLGVVVGLVLLMSMFSVRVIPTSADAAIVAQWTAGTPLNETLSEAVIVQDDDGLVYVIGGMTSTSFTTTANVSSYDPDTGAWQDLASLPQPTRGASGAYADGKIYVFGGYDSGAGWLDNTQIYDIAADSWSTGTALPQRLWQSKAAAGNDGLIYVFGGKNPSYVYVTNVYTYDPVADSWGSGSAMPVGTSGGAVVADGYTFYYVGGTTSVGATDAVYSYYTWGSWDTLPVLPQPTCGIAATIGADGFIYAFGGSDSESEYGDGFNQTYYFDPWNDEWNVAPDLPNYPRYLGAIGTEDGRILAIGGAEDRVTNAVSVMRIMSYSASVDPTIVQTGRTVMVTVSVEMANAVPDSFYGYAQLESGSGTTYSATSFQGMFEMTFGFNLEVPVGIPAGAYTIEIIGLEIGYAGSGGTDIEGLSLPLGVVVGETLDEQVQSLLDVIAGLEAQLAIQNGTVTAIATQLVALGTYLADLQTQIDAMEEQVDRLEGKADTASTYGMVNIVLVIVILVLVAVMLMMVRKKP